ncbi:hypothetical protein SAY87_016330 [Trapa incisa]|uniref:Uncharacterized protein n=1 Tax=Trapa incisa TaxID=236973 RepID=A0AAN7L9U3_9MYRT|nr:hypothetical protein SAY87_016330 [Trapa incisa]
MDVHGKDIKLYLWRFLNFFMRTTSFYVCKYPLASAILSFLLLLYLLYPFVFKIVLYTAPVITCIAVCIRVYISSEKVEDAKGKEGNVSRGFSKSDENVVRRPKKPLISAQMSKRRNFKMKTEELITAPEPPLEIKSDEQSIYGDGFTGKGEKEAFENPNVGDDASKGSGKEGKTSTMSQLDRDLEDAEYDDEEDHPHDDGKRVVEWNEDDQKNVMDLGFSELERNRRLESLIARRRARKLASALRGPTNLLDLDGSFGPSLSHITVPHIQIIKNDPFEGFAGGVDDDMLDSQIPGSAPSIMLPARNPFDIPYDPQEEKPNLMNDGFQQEFTTTNHPRDIYCRHESFTLGPFFSADIYKGQGSAGPSIYSRHDWQVLSESTLSSCKRVANEEDHDKLDKKLQCQEHNFSHGEEQQSKSPKELSKANVENEDGTEEDLGRDQYQKHVDLNIHPKKEAIVEPEEVDVNSIPSSASEEPEEGERLKERSEGQNVLGTENIGLLPEEHLRDESEKNMERNMHPKIESMDEPEEEDVKSIPSPTLEEHKQKVMEENNQGHDILDMEKHNVCPKDHLGDEFGKDMELELDLDLDLDLPPENVVLPEEPEEGNAKSNPPSTSEELGQQEVILQEISKGHDTLDLEKLDGFPKEHLEEESQKDVKLNVSPKKEAFTTPEEREERDMKSNSSCQEEAMLKDTGEGHDTLEMGNLEYFPNESDTPEEGSPIASSSSTANLPFCGSSQSFTEYIGRGLRHSTTYSIASDMLVEVSEMGSPRNILDDILQSPDLEEDELRKELEQAYHRQENAVDLRLLGVKDQLTNGRRDEEHTTADIKPSSSSPSPNLEGHSFGEVCSIEDMYTNRSNEIELGGHDSLESEIPIGSTMFIDNSMSHELQEMPSPSESSSTKIGDTLDEIIDDNNNLDKHSNGPPQHIANEIRDHTEYDIIPHAETLEENEDMNPFTGPMEETNMTCPSFDSTDQRAEDGYIKLESTGEERNPINSSLNN